MAAKISSLVLLAIVLGLTGGCVLGASDEQNDTPSSTTLVVVEDGEWDFRVDRSLRPEIDGKPSDRLTEADFQPLPGGPTYRVVVSDRGSHVSIRGDVLFEDGLVEGQRSAPGVGRIEYDLGEVWGGGRFVTWVANGTPQAELAIHGYGRAFVVCLRGPLVRPSPPWASPFQTNWRPADVQ